MKILGWPPILLNKIHQKTFRNPSKKQRAACVIIKSWLIAMNDSVRAALILAVLVVSANGVAGSQEKPQTPISLPAAAAEAKPPAPPPTNDPKEIVRRCVEMDHRNWERARSYTYRQREVEKQLGKNDEVKSTEIRTFDINFYYGHEYSRLVEKNDKPLSDAEKKKEEEKLDKFLARLRNQSDAEREKELAKEKKQREEGRAFFRDVVNAYDFTLLGEENINGADAWVIQANPRKDFHPTQPHADVLTKIKGKIWIEKKDYNWVKAEAETFDTISFGLFLLRIHKGARFAFERVHVNDEVWLVRRFYLNGGARLALVKNEAVEEEDVFSDYKKFVTSTRITPGQVVPDEKPK
jgi:hypothetical protein